MEHCIKNIFLDAGGVILNESSFEEKSADLITEIINDYNSSYSLSGYWSDVEEAVYRFVPKVYDYILYKNIDNINDYTKAKDLYKKNLKKANLEFQLMDGIKDFLMAFSDVYQIGILGQYGKDFKEYLEETNVLRYFTFTEIQDNYDLTKPDPRYFAAILNSCECKAAESIMIGDRIDKDIIPAKMTRMKTIRLKTGLHKNQEPRIPEEIPDLTVEKIKDIKPEFVKTIESKSRMRYNAK